MAKPISYGLVLEGQDAKDFDEYMKDPSATFTEETWNIMRELRQEMKNRGYI